MLDQGNRCCVTSQTVSGCVLRYARVIHLKAQDLQVATNRETRGNA